LQTETKLNIEYIQINPLKELEETIGKGSFDNLFKEDTSRWQVLLVAGYIDDVRLIDNIILR
jgi:pantothenate synthetase